MGAESRTIPIAALLGVAAFLLAASCDAGFAPPGSEGTTEAAPVSILLAGDVMLGRGVGPIAASDPSGLFEDVRLVVKDADLSLANLESPMTTRAHQSANPNALEADPSLASLIANAGFDVMSLANNHAGDAGPEGVLDTIAAVEASGMAAAGAGSDAEEAARPALLRVGDLTVAVLSFDATGAGLAAGSTPGVASWEKEAARNAVVEAAGQADVVVVSIHGGVELLPEADPRMESIAEQLASWGADVVWGHGPHVVQPVIIIPRPGSRGTVAATSLGNFIFDQRGPLTGGGAVLEVLADEEGVLAYRLGATTHRDLRVHFVGWELPEGNATLVDGGWWALSGEPEVVADRGTSVDPFEWGVVVAASTGRITQTDQDETVVSFRHVPGPHPVRDGLPEIDWLDANGLSAHLGIYDAGDLTPIWVAGMVPAPVAALAACDGSIALAYSTLDDPTVIATGAAVWRQFGLDATDRLPGPGMPACADVDGDGSSEPVILRRS